MKSKGQSILEYVLILGIVGMALGAMQFYFRRGIQGAIKVAADDIGEQRGAEEIDPQKGTRSNSLITQVTRGPQKGDSATQRTFLSKDGKVTSTFSKTTTTEGFSVYTSEREE